MNISSRSTKAEILAAYEALRVQHEAQTITWPLVANTGKIIFTETKLFFRDLHAAGTVVVQWISRTVDDLRQPVLRSW